MTTGIVTSRGTVSSVGVAPDAEIVAIKVLDDTWPSGTFYYFAEIVAALKFILNRPDVKVINMSLATFALYDGHCDNTTSWNMAGASAINTLRNNGVISFAASGNDGSGTQMSSPACLSNVVSVGAPPSVNVVDGNSVVVDWGEGCVDQGETVDIQADIDFWPIEPVSVTWTIGGVPQPTSTATPTPTATATPTVTPTATAALTPGPCTFLAVIIVDTPSNRPL